MCLQLRQEKVELEQTLEQEQECLVNKLMRKIEKLETETAAKQNDLETLRREKIELENTLEQEQEALVNKLWKRMDKLEAEKRMLQGKLEQPISNPPSPADFNQGDRANNLSSHIQHLRDEVSRFREQLTSAQEEREYLGFIPISSSSGRVSAFVFSLCS
ncbi:Coiled-coil domain-containing protein 6 [Chionoecetes opilio]|uniref:Coiled-coil domain-containing protein 6 n=1 Tax=Chionoecetes opilio TaxID=41210 RepID=A0A8J5BU85_CHIOP|nr:Coiled-coil domain-containing protein 6 [Chionoecetes opilio]